MNDSNRKCHKDPEKKSWHNVQLHANALEHIESTNSSKVPFAGVSVKLMKFANEQEKMKILGPVTMKAFGKYSIGEMPKDAHPKFPISYMPKIIGFMLKGLFRKMNNPSPFFNGKEPIAKVNVLS